MEKLEPYDMTKVLQTKSEIEKQLKDQLDLLKVLCDSYDAGNHIVAKSIATAVRVLVHDTGKSYSVLGQLDLKKRNFFDTSSSSMETSTEVKRVGSFCGLVGISVGNSKQNFIPYLDEPMPGFFGYVPFDEYWNRTIFIDQHNISFSRRDIILAVTNQDGGAHVDPEIDEKYKKLARENTLGWKVSNDGKNWNNTEGAELAAVRQIAHEILRTFIPDYPNKKINSHGGFAVLGGMSILFGKSVNIVKNIITPKAVRKVGRNEKCPCGSGVKYKKCHGK